jgi:hypothetical protein
MRLALLALPVLAALAAAPARADNFAGAVGGIMIPVADSHSNSKDGWTDLVGSGPKLAIRAGATGASGLGAMLSADWTPVNSNNQSQFVDVSAHRFRILAHVVFDKIVVPKVSLFVRAGGGIDIAHASLSTTPVLGTSYQASTTDVGWAFELGGGVYFHLGSVQLGGELALPFGGHSHKSTSNTDIPLNYTSTDIDVLFGVRFTSR